MGCLFSIPLSFLLSKVAKKKLELYPFELKTIGGETFTMVNGAKKTRKMI